LLRFFDIVKIRHGAQYVINIDDIDVK
jgi:hypothetical protein